MNATTTTSNSNSNSNAAAAAAIIPAANAIRLCKVAADYKLQRSEAFLLQGRVNKNAPNRPYYHVTMEAGAAAMPAAPATQLPEMQAGINKLWHAVTLELLKDRAASLDAGASITLQLTTADVNSFIADMGNRERQSISGEELDSYATSYAFQALAMVHTWNPQQVARVAVALRQYAAPAHRKPQSDASILLARLDALPSLLTGDDSALDADITRVHTWLTAKLRRDNEAASANLADSI